MSNEAEEKVRIRMTISREVYERAVKFAEDQDRTINNLMAHAVATYLKRYKK